MRTIRNMAAVATLATIALYISGCTLMTSDWALDSGVQYEDGSAERINDGLVSYEQLATDPFGWEDFDVIPRDVWFQSITDWNEISHDERLGICDMIVGLELTSGVRSAQDQFIATAVDSGYTEDRAWTAYAVAVTGCEEISYF